jgi:hypothetical protein
VVDHVALELDHLFVEHLEALLEPREDGALGVAGARDLVSELARRSLTRSSCWLSISRRARRPASTSASPGSPVNGAAGRGAAGVTTTVVGVGCG